MIEKMIFFDFDYTLAKTVENVWIWSPRGTRTHKDKTYRVVNPLEYGVLKLADDEHLDSDSFVEFGKLNVNRAKPISLNMFLLDYFMSSESNLITILSARPQKVEDYIYEFLKLNAVKNYKKIIYKGVDSSDPSKKYDYLKEKVTTFNPKEVFLFDDSKKVINFARDHFYNDFKNINFTSCLVRNKISSTCLCFE